MYSTILQLTTVLLISRSSWLIPSLIGLHHFFIIMLAWLETWWSANIRLTTGISKLIYKKKL